MRRMTNLALGLTLMLPSGASALGQATSDQNMAMNSPDELAWQLYIEVNANAGGSNALFETWASDTDTFKPNPTFPTKPATLALHAPALVIFQRVEAQKKHMALPAIPPGGDFSEESRRNRATFDFIVKNDLYRVSGLQKAFGKTLSFPADSIEVKANWIPITSVFKDTTYKGTAADIPKFFHVNRVTAPGAPENGKQYALVSMHIISKQVPNWTWATFESRFNPKRCDVNACMDSFGTAPSYTPPNALGGQGYADCNKTSGLAKMIADAKLDAAFSNYCLKGTQIDFTDNMGLAIRLGNSVTERDFPHSSCMTCHSMAGWDAKGQPNDFNFVLGSPDPSLYWKVPTPTPATANYPLAGINNGLTRISTSADFVWAIPFCAYDDVTNPKKPQASPCIANGS